LGWISTQNRASDVARRFQDLPFDADELPLVAVLLVGQLHTAGVEDGLECLLQLLVRVLVEDVFDCFLFTVRLHGDPVVLLVDEKAGDLDFVRVGGRDGTRRQKAAQHGGGAPHQQRPVSPHGDSSSVGALRRHLA
jgi:hypothetical protein